MSKEVDKEVISQRTYEEQSLLSIEKSEEVLSLDMECGREKEPPKPIGRNLFGVADTG